MPCLVVLNVEYFYFKQQRRAEEEARSSRDKFRLDRDSRHQGAHNASGGHSSRLNEPRRKTSRRSSSDWRRSRQQQRGAQGAGRSSSLTDGSKHSAVPEATSESGKRQVVPALVDVSASAELLALLSVS